MGSAASSPRRRESQDSAMLSSSMILSSALSPRLAKSRCDAPPPPPAPTSVSEISNSEPPPPPPPGADSIASAAASASVSFANPGPYEQASLDCKRLVAIETFDGFRCDINKQVSPYMAAVHSFWLGTNSLQDGRKSTYTFLTQVADERGGLLMARVDLGRGGIDGRVHRALLGGLALAKLQVSASQEGQADQCLAELDFGGMTWTGNVKYGSMGGGSMFGMNYFQAVTSRLSMGGEGMYIGANQKMLSSYTVKYTMPAKTGDEETLDGKLASGAAAAPISDTTALGSSTFVANYNAGQQACTVNYKRVVTPGRVSVGAELSFSPLTLGSEVLLGAEFKLQRSKYCVCVDPSNLRVQSLLEAKLGMAHGSPSLQLAAEVAPWSDEMKFGYGLTIDG